MASVSKLPEGELPLPALRGVVLPKSGLLGQQRGLDRASRHNARMRGVVNRSALLRGEVRPGVVVHRPWPGTSCAEPIEHLLRFAVLAVDLQLPPAEDALAHTARLQHVKAVGSAR